MAINSKKLLPPSKSSSSDSSALTVRKSNISVSKLIKTDTKSESAPKTKVFSDIKTKVIEVDKLLKGSVLNKKKNLEKEKLEKEQSKRSKKEKNLEAKKDKKKTIGPKFKIPTPSFFDRIKDFITNTLLGYGLIKLLEWFDGEDGKAFFDGIASIAEFLKGTGSTILNGLVTFIEWSYDLYDNFRGWVGDNFGEEGLEKFDTLSKNLNTFFNAAIIGGLALLKFGGLRRGIFGLIGTFRSLFRRGLVRAIKRVSLKLFGKGATKALGKGLSAAGGLIGKGFSAVGKGFSAAGGAAKGFLARSFGVGSRFASTPFGNFISGKIFDARLAKRSIGKFAMKVFGPAAKFVAPILKGVLPVASKFLKRIPILGPLVVALASLLSGEPVGQAAFKGVGAALGGALGSFIPIPILGTLLGEAIGAFVGDLLYYGIVEGDWKKSGKVFGQTLKAILSVGEPILNFFKEGGQRFIKNFPTVDVPDFKPGLLLGNLASKDPVLNKLINFELKIPKGGGRHTAIDLIPGVPDEWKTALKEGFSIKKILNGLPGLREVLGFVAQYIPGLKGFVKNGALMKIPNLAMLLPPGIPFLIPHIGKSFLPQLFNRDKKPPKETPPIPVDKSSGSNIGSSSDTGAAATGEGNQRRAGNIDIGKSNDIVNIGKDLISKGFSVAEHPDFTKTPSPSGGTYTPDQGFVSDVHKGAGHYESRAIDVTDWRGSMEDSKARYRSVLDSIYDGGNMGNKLLIHDSWGIADQTGKDGPGGHGHPQHMHIEVRDKGGMVGKGLFANLGGPEFVLDADTTKALEDNVPGFLAALNKADYNGALSVLRNYASYEGNMQQFIPIPIPMKGENQSQYQQPSGGGFVISGGEPEWNESLYVGG